MAEYKDIENVLTPLQKVELTSESKHRIQARLREEWNAMETAPRPGKAIRRLQLTRRFQSLVAGLVLVAVLGGGTVIWTRQTNVQHDTKVNSAIHMTGNNIVNRGMIVNTPQATEPLSVQIKNLLKSHGWTSLPNTERITQVTMPASFQSGTPGFPTGLYWNYLNTLSKSAGLDMTPYLGQSLTLHITQVTSESTSKDVNPDYAVCAASGNRVVGAWIQGNRLSSINYSFFADITKMTWGAWLTQQGYSAATVKSQLVPNNASPTQVIQKFVELTNQHRVADAYSLTTFQYQMTMMTINLNWNSAVYHNYMKEPDLLSNVVYWHLLSMKPVHFPGIQTVNREDVVYRTFPIDASTTLTFAVTWDGKYIHPMTQSNGRGGYNFALIRETPNGPWRISGLSTGG